MKNLTILADLNCLNKLVNGKIVVIDLKSNTYTSYNKGTYTSDIPETFNPEDYALLETNYCPVVVDAPRWLKEEHLVNKYWNEQQSNSSNRRLTRR
jgi:hypothetical protein